jgi:nuclear transport factor 2 (NTF2) superfamily protein
MLKNQNKIHEIKRKKLKRERKKKKIESLFSVKIGNIIAIKFAIIKF